MCEVDPAVKIGEAQYGSLLSFRPVWCSHFIVGLSVLLPLAGCQNGNIFDRLVGGSAAASIGPPDPPGQQTRSADSEAGLWLGRRAVPLVASDVAPERKDPTDGEAPVHIWQVRAGESVASAVRRWAEVAGYTPLPNFSTVESWSFIVSQEFSGNFEDALVWLSNGFSQQTVKPVAILFANRILDLVDQPTAAMVAGVPQSGPLAQHAAVGD